MWRGRRIKGNRIKAEIQEWQRANTDWFHAAKWGVFTHFLADPASSATAIDLSVDAWNRRVDAVNVDALAEQIVETGAGYAVLTLGQNSGFFCSPNRSYDEIVGATGRLSRRDLMADFADALIRRGLRMIAYSPSHGPANDRHAVEALGFTPHWDASQWQLRPGIYAATGQVDDRLTRAQRNWEAIAREWSLRWGERISGWWIDGCYYADRMYRHPDGPNFRTYAEALKAGNPNSIVAFNPGVKAPIVCYTPYEDYTAGELNDLYIGNKWYPLKRTVDGAQLHVLTYLGEWWGEGPARFPTELAAGYAKHVTGRGGVISWDVPLVDELIPQTFLRQLSSINAAVRG
jgi:hypothetical protein